MYTSTSKNKLKTIIYFTCRLNVANIYYYKMQTIGI